MLESYLSKLRCSGPLTGNKCPKIEWCGKWILDLLANKTCRAKEESHRRALVRCCVLPICLQQLHYQNYLSQFQWSERRTFLSNQCKIEMHYLYQISRMQLSFVASLAMNSLKKHICCKMLHSVSFFILWRKTDRIQWIPCVHLPVWFYPETRKKNSLDHFCIEIFLELLTTTKLQSRTWNIP